MNIRLKLKNSETMYDYRLEELRLMEDGIDDRLVLTIIGMRIKENNPNDLELSEGRVYDKFLFEPYSTNPPETIEFY